MKLKTLLIAACAATLTTGCASIFSGGPQDIGINSTPDGAAVTITDKRGTVVFNGTTPATAELARSDGFFSAQRYTVKIDKQGFGSETVELRSTANGWTFGNLLLGGVIGIVIDGATGAIFSYRPKDIDVTLGSTAELKIVPLESLTDEERKSMVPIA